MRYQGGKSIIAKEIFEIIKKITTDSGKRFGGWIFSNKLRKFVEEEFQYC